MADVLILNELKEVHRLLIVQQYQTNEQLDRIERKLNDDFVSPALERAVKKVMLRTISIDRKV